jgi:GPI ethanolamine phosphate transferase 1
MNSVGVLPTAYLSGSQEHISELLLLNAVQIEKQFVMKEVYQQSTEIVFQPFVPTNNHTEMHDRIRALIDRKEYDTAQALTSDLIVSLLAGIEYYHTYILIKRCLDARYDWFMLRSVVTLGYITWMIYSILLTVSAATPLKRCNKYIGVLNDAFTIATFAIAAYFYHKQASYRYYLYAAFPIYFLREIVIMRGYIYQYFKQGNVLMNIIAPLLYLGTMHVLVSHFLLIV